MVSIDVSSVPWPEFWPIVLGLLFVLVTLVMPLGLMGLWHSMLALVWRRLLRRWIVADGGKLKRWGCGPFRSAS